MTSPLHSTSALLYSREAVAELLLSIAHHVSPKKLERILSDLQTAAVQAGRYQDNVVPLFAARQGRKRGVAPSAVMEARLAQAREFEALASLLKAECGA